MIVEEICHFAVFFRVTAKSDNNALVRLRGASAVAID
jgi:hypothetical protein